MHLITEDIVLKFTPAEIDLMRRVLTVTAAQLERDIDRDDMTITSEMAAAMVRNLIIERLLTKFMMKAEHDRLLRDLDKQRRSAVEKTLSDLAGEDHDSGEPPTPP